MSHDGVEATRVRALRAGDLARFAAYRADAEVARLQGWSPMTRDESAEFLAAVVGAEVFVKGGWIQLAIADAETDALLGDIGVFLDDEGTAAELGISLSRSAQGRGHAVRSLRAVLARLWDTTDVRRVRAVIDARNAPCLRLFTRLGFRVVGEQSAVCKGEICTELVHLLERRGGHAGRSASS